MTTILVEQNAIAALNLADRAIILDTGQKVFDGTAQEVLDNADLTPGIPRDLGKNSGGKAPRDLEEMDMSDMVPVPAAMAARTPHQCRKVRRNVCGIRSAIPRHSGAKRANGSTG